MQITRVKNTIGTITADDPVMLESFRHRSPITAKEPSDLKYYSNYYNGNTDQGYMPGPGTHKFLNKNEQSQSNPNYKEFSYYINDIGFRDHYPAKDTKSLFGFFGCSMTLGEGLPTEDNFPYLVSKQFNKQHLNFGLPGVGAYRIALIFAAAANVWDMDTAVITFPNWARFHYVDTKNNMKLIHLPYPIDNEECESVRHDILNDFSDQYMLSATKDAINYIVMVAKLKNINLVLSAWDPDVSRMIETITGYNVPRYNLWTPSEPTRDGDFARDKIHPGTNLVNLYAEKLKQTIQEKNYVAAI
jgi:hypothetical protein